MEAEGPVNYTRRLPLIQPPNAIGLRIENIGSSGPLSFMKRAGCFYLRI